MKRWIQESDCNRISFKCLIECLEVILLIWKDLVQIFFSLFYSFR